MGHAIPDAPEFPVGQNSLPHQPPPPSLGEKNLSDPFNFLYPSNKITLRKLFDLTKDDDFDLLRKNECRSNTTLYKYWENSEQWVISSFPKKKLQIIIIFCSKRTFWNGNRNSCCFQEICTGRWQLGKVLLKHWKLFSVLWWSDDWQLASRSQHKSHQTRAHYGWWHPGQICVHIQKWQTGSVQADEVPIIRR